MSALAWLATREPTPPPSLAALLAMELSSSTRGSSPQEFLDAAEAVFTRYLAGEPVAPVSEKARHVDESHRHPGEPHRHPGEPHRHGNEEPAPAKAAGRGPARARVLAADLLTADALVTYALECAAEDPMSLESVARDALHRIASWPVQG